MSNGFWGKLKRPFTVLAPMAEVTDSAFRRIIVECGKPDVIYTEFVSADGLASERGRPRLLRDLEYSQGEHPIVAQFFGADPENMRFAASLARELGFDGVDINMGCPDSSIIKQGAGIGLAKSPALARELVAAAKEGAGEIPVSVKTRLGLNKIDIGGWIGAILETKIAALVVHLRTMKEMSKVPAHWDVLPEIVKMAHEYDTLVLGNGDVETLGEVKDCAERYGADGVMIGRGIFKNPWLFNPDYALREPTKQERLALLLRHAKYFIEACGDDGDFNVLKKFFGIYVTGWSGAKEMRALLMETKNLEDVMRVVTPHL